VTALSATVSAIVELLGSDPPKAPAISPAVLDVTHDSRDVRPGSLFVAIRGATHDGHDHIARAVENGAVAILADHEVEAGVPVIVVADTRRSMAAVARLVHGEPDVDLSILGVTGTNGKTTVAHLCEAVWLAAGRSCGIIGTLGARYDGIPVPLARTTPEASDTQRLLGVMRDAGVRSVAMEVSSHAIAQHRIDAITFTAVGFTNLTQDHLDFHGSMDDYYAAKRSLFEPEHAAVAIVDIDSEAGTAIAAATELRVVTVGFDPSAAISATDVWSTPTGSSFTLTTPVGDRPVELPLSGSFNIANALVAAGLLLEDGIGVDEIAAGLSSVAPVAGRMEVVRHDGPFTVVVDYAHTPDAIDVVLADIRSATSGRVIAVIGAGGDRDRDKRQAMGAAAARHGDVVIVTTDNPRSEAPAQIADEVAKGARRFGGIHLTVELDRRRAIGDAIDMAGPGDIVVVMGKGHEQGQEISGMIRPFDDREVAKDALRAAGWDVA